MLPSIKQRDINLIGMNFKNNQLMIAPQRQVILKIDKSITFDSGQFTDSHRNRAPSDFESLGHSTNTPFVNDMTFNPAPNLGNQVNVMISDGLDNNSI